MKDHELLVGLALLTHAPSRPNAQRGATRPRSPTANSTVTPAAFARYQSRSPDPVDAMHNAVIWAHSSSDTQAQACGPSRQARSHGWIDSRC
jgi:hypothetical protein